MAYANPDDQRAAWRRHYQENREVYLERQRKKKAENRAFIQEYKESYPCTDCGLFYPFYVMDFDHLDRATKFKNVSLLTSSTRAAIEREIAKCELVCSNCHRQRTHDRE